MWKIVLLLVSAFAGGALNAVAGGGSFLSFPALVFAGLPSVAANATNTVALFPGAFASAFSYRHGLARLEGISLGSMIVISLLGGIGGAILLLVTPDSTFNILIPWLLLFATVIFTFGRQMGALIKRHVHFGFAALAISQFVIAIYGGYFGGGIGILMLAALAVFGMTDLNAMNGLKAILSGCLNAIAVVVFVAAGKVYWPQASIMVIAAIAGGYGGAYFAQRLPAKVVRGFVICTGITMTAYFFYHAYGPRPPRQARLRPSLLFGADRRDEPSIRRIVLFKHLQPALLLIQPSERFG